MSTLCSNCREPIGQWKGSASPAAFNCAHDEPCNPCITVAEWDARIEEIEELLEKLKKQRNIARTEMNRVHDPLIQQVPLEIASHIFTLHIYNDHTDMAEYPHPLVLASVCKKWREIAFPTPQIWTTLVVYDCYEWKFPANLAEQWCDTPTRRGSQHRRLQPPQPLPPAEAFLRLLTPVFHDLS